MTAAYRKVRNGLKQVNTKKDQNEREAKVSPTFKSANVDTPPATRKVQRYSGKVYLIP